MDKETKQIVASNLTQSFVILAKETIMHNPNIVDKRFITEKSLFNNVYSIYKSFFNFLEKEEQKLKEKEKRHL